MFELKMQLDWLPNAQFAGLIYAKERGWYKKAGIDLELIPWYPQLNQVDVLKKNKNAIVSSDDNLIIKGVLNGEKIKAIAVMMQYSGLGWMVLKEHNITKFEQLRGRKIGIHTDGRTGIAVALNHVGLKTSDVEIEDVGFDYESLMLEHKVIAMQCLSLVEAIELRKKEIEFELFLAKNFGYLTYSQVFATNEELINREPNMLEDFIRISFDGWRAAFADREQATEYIVDRYLKDSNKSLELEMLKELEVLFPYHGDYDKMGAMEETRWNNSISLLKFEGLDTSNITAKDVMVSDIIDKILAR